MDVLLVYLPFAPSMNQGYAYVEFASPEVAGIVASTMNGYFLFDKQLVCKVLMFGEIHPNLFDGAGHTFRRVNWHGLYRQKYNADRYTEIPMKWFHDVWSPSVKVN